MKFYADLISQITDEKDPKELTRIEAIMRDTHKGALSDLKLEDLEPLAHKAWNRRQTEKAQKDGASIAA